MVSYTPKVKEAHAFREISQDFTTPEEIFREAIANSLDAYGRRIWLRTSVENRRGRETVLIDLSDDGIGMNIDTIGAFFNLSDSVKPKANWMSDTVRRMTGYKGHGTIRPCFSRTGLHRSTAIGREGQIVGIHECMHSGIFRMFRDPVVEPLDWHEIASEPEAVSLFR
jgi:hypothetical protein